MRSYDLEGKPIEIGLFFSKFSEFSTNEHLKNQTVRILKTLTRDPSCASEIAETVDDGFALTLTGTNREYRLCFGISDEEISLRHLG